MSWRPYWAYFTKALSARTAYSGSLLMYLLSSGVTFGVTILVWRFATGGPSQQPQLFAYLSLAFCANFALGSTLEGQIGERIREGYIAMDLLKPVNFRGLYLAKTLGDYLFQAGIAVAALIVALLFLGSSLAPASLGSALVALVSLFLGGLVQFQFCFLIVQAVFITTNNYGVAMTRISLHQALSGVFAPITLYPPLLLAWAHALPFHHIIYTPCALWLGMIPLDQAPHALLSQLLWILGLGVVGNWVFGRVLNQLTVQGAEMRTLRICFKAFKAALQTKLEYRVDMALGIGAAIGFQLATLGMLTVLMNNKQTLGGWDANGLLLLLGLTAITHGMSELFCNHIWFIPYYVVRGQLDRLMVLPVPTLPYFLVTAPELHCIGNLGSGSVMVFIALHRLGVGGPVLALLPLWVLCGTVVYTGLLILCAAISFWVMGSQNYHYMVTVSLLRGSAYPHTVFPWLVQGLLAWVFPFAAVSFIPGQALTGRIALLPGVGLPIAMAVMTGLIGWTAWEIGLRHYESTGS